MLSLKYALITYLAIHKTQIVRWAKFNFEL